MSDELNFHYKREERLAMHSAPATRGPERRFLRANRGRVILLLALIVGLFAVYNRSPARAAYTADVAGWRVTLRGVAAGEDALAVLDVVAAGGATTGERLFAVFRAGDAELRLSEVLPAQGGTVTISGRLLATGRARELTAEVSIGAKKAALRRVLERE
jgi:hypothetical protein